MLLFYSLDGVVICTPTYTHQDLVTKAFQKGMAKNCSIVIYIIAYCCRICRKCMLFFNWPVRKNDIKCHIMA